MRREAAAPETELIVIENINAIELFTGEKVDPLLEGISEKVKAFVPDLSTDTSRKKIASIAHQVSKAKTGLDKLGKDLVADWKTKAKAVDASRKHIRDSLDYLKAEVRQPLTEWEEAEKQKEEEARLLAEYLADWDQAIADDDLINREREVARKEAEFAKQEEERRQKEEADRMEKERIEREERLKKEAAETAKREAEEKVAKAKAEKEESERKLKEAEQKRKDDALKAEIERKNAAARAELERKAAIQEAERKAQQEADRKEADRLEAERVAKEKADRKAANLNHQGKINREALADFVKIEGVTESLGKDILRAIAKGDISHISINY